MNLLLLVLHIVYLLAMACVDVPLSAAAMMGAARLADVQGRSAGRWLSAAPVAAALTWPTVLVFWFLPAWLAFVTGVLISYIGIRKVYQTTPRKAILPWVFSSAVKVAAALLVLNLLPIEAYVP